jgi:hypothetical protein
MYLCVPVPGSRCLVSWRPGSGGDLERDGCDLTRPCNMDRQEPTPHWSQRPRDPWNGTGHGLLVGQAKRPGRARLQVPSVPTTDTWTTGPCNLDTGPYSQGHPAHPGTRSLTATEPTRTCQVSKTTDTQQGLWRAALSVAPSAVSKHTPPTQGGNQITTNAQLTPWHISRSVGTVSIISSTERPTRSRSGERNAQHRGSTRHREQYLRQLRPRHPVVS